MDYESLSTIVLVVIVAILMVSWLPRRTVQGMKQVIKHQSDRYSASLHLIDEGDGTRFSDARTVELKGTPMASPHTVRTANMWHRCAIYVALQHADARFSSGRCWASRCSCLCSR